MALSVETVVNICVALLTASLIILNYIILRASIKQNDKSIELYEENLKVSEETLQLNKALLEENRRMIERQKMENRPNFVMKKGGFKIDPTTGRPQIYLENIGGKDGQARNIHVIITKNLKSIVEDVEINRSIKSGAPLNIELDIPASVIEYEVHRKDGGQMKEQDTIFFSVTGILEYTHVDDGEAYVDPFTDSIEFKIGNDYMNNADYTYSWRSRRPSKNDTWDSMLGTGHGTTDE